MKESIKMWLYRAGSFVSLFCSVVSCVNSFNNEIECKTLEEIQEMRLCMDCE